MYVCISRLNPISSWHACMHAVSMPTKRQSRCTLTEQLACQLLNAHVSSLEGEDFLSTDLEDVAAQCAGLLAALAQHLQGEHTCSSERGGRDLRLHPDDGEGVCRGDEEHHGHVRPESVEGHERQEALGCCPSCVLGHGRPAPHALPFMKTRPIHENTSFHTTKNMEYVIMCTWWYG